MKAPTKKAESVNRRRENKIDQNGPHYKRDVTDGASANEDTSLFINCIVHVSNVTAPVISNEQEMTGLRYTYVLRNVRNY